MTAGPGCGALPLSPAAPGWRRAAPPLTYCQPAWPAFSNHQGPAEGTALSATLTETPYIGPFCSLGMSLPPSGVQHIPSSFGLICAARSPLHVAERLPAFLHCRLLLSPSPLLSPLCSSSACLCLFTACASHLSWLLPARTVLCSFPYFKHLGSSLPTHVTVSDSQFVIHFYDVPIAVFVIITFAFAFTGIKSSIPLILISRDPS